MNLFDRKIWIFVHQGNGKRIGYYLVGKENTHIGMVQAFYHIVKEHGNF